MHKLAINGFGRIGRCLARYIIDSENFSLTAINIGSEKISTFFHLLKYDSTYGRLSKEIVLDEKNKIVTVGKHTIDILTIKSIPNWKNVDIILECTGSIKKREDAIKHLSNGSAQKMLLSYPLKDADKSIVYGVNHQIIEKSDKVISNASCTTNCAAPILNIIDQNYNIVEGFLTTIHAYTNDQSLLDKGHTDPRRARAAGLSIIPTKTNASKNLSLIIPSISGKLESVAIRVPVFNVSMVEVTLLIKEKTSIPKINDLFKTHESEVLGYSDIPLVSIDFNKDTHATVIDGTQTKTMEHLIKIGAWYDNEWGFTNQMIRTLCCMI